MSQDIIDRCLAYLTPMANKENVRKCWCINNSDYGDPCESLCKDCLDKRVAEIIKEHGIKEGDANVELDILWICCGESDHPEICEDCGALLEYNLTDDGVEEEIDHFLYHGLDLTRSRECAELEVALSGMICMDENHKFYKKGMKLCKIILEQIEQIEKGKRLARGDKC